MSSNEEKYSKYTRYADNDVSWQEECLKNISDSQNVILSSPTGSGKTRVFLEWAKQKEDKPIIITSPIKALSNQRYRELVEAGYTVGLETGDIKKVPDNCDFICCTQEIYTNKYLNLEDVTLIMDEFHYIFENHERARTYVDALHNSKAKNILLCSATLGNIDELKEYIERVSKRDFKTHENNSRLTSLYIDGDIGIDEIKDSLVVAFSRRNIDFILNRLYESREYQSEEKNEQIKQLAKNHKIKNERILDDARKGIAGYYGALLPKEKFFLEKCYEQKLIDTIVGTDALALGVNFPVEKVIFSQLTKYYDGPISKNLFEQLIGRAGRKGYFDSGYAGYCSELACYTEENGYNTGRVFDELLEMPNENLSIVLTPNIKNILQEKTTIEDESYFISEYSTVRLDENNVYQNIFDAIQYIKEEAFEYNVDRIVEERFIPEYDNENEDDEYDDYYDEYYDEYEEDENEDEKRVLKEELQLKEKEFRENIDKAYFDEFSPQKNCAIFADIICGVEPDKILSKYANSDNFYNMLQFRKYVKSLPRKYRIGLTGISSMIREIDETAIDEFREDSLVEEILEELEEENRLNGDNIMQVLKTQKNIKQMAERVDVMEEQLRIAEQYGLEDY